MILKKCGGQKGSRLGVGCRLSEPRLLPSCCFVFPISHSTSKKSYPTTLHDAINMWLCKKNDVQLL